MHVEQNKILGCLVGAAAADAMGAATEVRTQQQIKDYFGGWVTTFQKPPADTFGRCYATLPPAFLFYAFDRMFLFAYLYFRPIITAFLQQEEE